ncbi:MAG: hypothetical protein Q8N18_05565 [Opitutaceae bacterium]|nr:hypothetical protein [Opitutaceae bacterium]
MKTNVKLVVAAAILSLVVAPIANAAVGVLTPVGSVGGAPVGVSKVNFDDLVAGAPLAPAAGGLAIQPSGGAGVTVTRTNGGGVVIGEDGVNAAKPFLSGGNGLGFAPGGLDQPNGEDNTPYLITGAGGSGNSVTLVFPGPQLYMGLLWGSVDATNSLAFYNGDPSNPANLVGTVTGANVAAAPNGNQGVNGTLYVNITSTTPFDRVVATSGVTTFEFDNVAFNPTIPNPCTVCVRSHGYFKNHESEWAALAPQVKLGTGPGVTYTAAQLDAILSQPTKGNGLVSLAHQLIAAKLNILRGACAPQGVLAAIAAADVLIGNAIIPPVGGASVPTNTTSGVAGILDAYNNGKAPGGPAHCN